MNDNIQSPVSNAEDLYQLIERELKSADLSDPDLTKVITKHFLKPDINDDQASREAFDEIIQLAEKRAKDVIDG